MVTISIILRNLGVHIILFTLKKQFIKWKKKKIFVEAWTKLALWDANYDRENEDSTNAFRLSHFKWCEFLQILFDIVAYARHFLPVEFFPKYCFNKLCIQLPQNVTWPMNNACD